ncbi:MAG TPA: divalent-cation tolerance protein CutA [Rhodospirillales bacterium]|nr:divalent-cation tolerance protein CutA [Rhodospirillales bacterium]
MSAVMIYVTTGSREEAVAIGRAVVGERLAACANVTPFISSIYWWDGRLQEEQEAALMLKTRRDLADQVIARVKEMHSYDCPCVVSFSIDKGNEDFLEWIIRETSQ